MLLISTYTSGNVCEIEKISCDVERLKRVFTEEEVEILLSGGQVTQEWAGVSCVSELQK